MLLIRCTQKLQKEINLHEHDLLTGVIDPAGIGDWYANLMYFGKRKGVLFTHAGSLFSFLAFPLKKPDLNALDHVFRNTLRPVLESEGFAREEMSGLMLASRKVVYGTPTNRSVLGSMNDIALRYKTYFSMAPFSSPSHLAVITKHINRAPLSAIGYSRAIDKLLSLIA